MLPIEVAVVAVLAVVIEVWLRMAQERDFAACEVGFLVEKLEESNGLVLVSTHWSH